MKRIIVLILMFAAWSGVALASVDFPPFFEEGGVVGIGDYVTLSASEPAFSLRVPGNWTLMDNDQLQEIYKDADKHYVLKGPRNSVFGPGYAALIITAKRKDPLGPEVDSLKAYSEYLLKERLPAKGVARENTRSDVMVRYRSLLGSKSYGAPSSFRKVAWQVRETADWFLDIRYTAEEADFEKYLPAFEEAKRSLKLP